MYHGFKKCLVLLAIFFYAEVFLWCCYGCSWRALITEEYSPGLNLNLPVVEIRDKFIPYEEFCQRNPGECKISEPSIIELTTKTKNLLLEVNIAVNFEIRFALDKIQYNKEEFWAYPISGMGDCEDVALEKRFRLTKLGLPIGTFAMDRFTNQILLWYQLPYNFEARERPDGKWERFDQSIWTFY
jgi:hypothetical protein